MSKALELFFTNPNALPKKSGVPERRAAPLPPPAAPATLFACPYCGHGCSKYAEACPQCGRFFQRFGNPVVVDRSGWNSMIRAT